MALARPPPQDFLAEGADAVVEDLAGVTIDALFNAVYEKGTAEEIEGKAEEPGNASPGQSRQRR